MHLLPLPASYILRQSQTVPGTHPWANLRPVGSSFHPFSLLSSAGNAGVNHCAWPSVWVLIGCVLF